MRKEEIRKTVRDRYARIARGESDGCCGPQPCGCNTPASAEAISRTLGYSDKELKAVPDGANLGLGCGNPIAIAGLKKGETVVDLGSGAGFDCFLAARAVGAKGQVIGVDMTPDMIEKARANARKGKYRNVEFRLGEIESLPVADGSADVIISNCVINLSPDKTRVFQEAFRILKPGGRLMVSDIVLLRPLPAVLQKSVEAYSACISGALLKSAYLKAIRAAGFQPVNVLEETAFPVELIVSEPSAKAAISAVRMSRAQAKNVAESVVSVKIDARKPAKEAK
jgi:arsenite methyltransferase